MPALTTGLLQLGLLAALTVLAAAARAPVNPPPPGDPSARTQLLLPLGHAPTSHQQQLLGDNEQLPQPAHSPQAPRNDSNAPRAPAAVVDFWLLALFWPPAVVTPAAQSRARHAVIRQEAHAGFWTHGLWPVDASKKILEYCSTRHLDPDSLVGFESSLRYYLRSGNTAADTAGDTKFWDHEWLRHGTCSGMDQLGYFLALFHASASADPASALRTAGLFPSNLQPYTLKQVTDALRARFGVSFNTHIGLKCKPGPGSSLTLQEVRLCLDKAAYGPYNCSAYAEWVRPGIHLDTCGSDLAARVWIPEFLDKGADLGFPWGILGIVGGAVSLLAVLAAAGFYALQAAGKLPSVFQPRLVELVHYDLVHTPVRVLCEPLDMSQLWRVAPYIAEFVDDLPEGMGIKGGIARKLLKELYGTPEPHASFDIDVLVFIDNYNPADRKAARELVTGMRLGGLVLQAQDVEVMTKGWLGEYFTSRDVTLNEVLILKQAPGVAVFYYTRDALRDAQLQMVRPCVHGLKSEYNLNWAVSDTGVPYVSPSQVCRCLVRYLKNHGIDYAFDAGTWAHYRRERLNKMQLFKVLRPFHDDSAAMQRAVDHLIDIGFLCRRDVLRAGGVNLLWGLLLQEVNATVAQNSGGRLTLGELDPDGVERWVDHKKAQVASKLIANEMRGRRTGYMPADEGVIDLGLFHMPAALEHYIASGPTFDLSRRLDQEMGSAVTELSRSFSAEGGLPAPAAHPSKRVWVAQRSVTEASSDALLAIARHSFTAPSGTSPAAAWLSSSPQLAQLLGSAAAEDEETSGHDGDGDGGSAGRRGACKTPSPGKQQQQQQQQRPDAARRLEVLESLKREAAERSNKAYKQQGGTSGSAVARSGSSINAPSTAAAGAAAAGSSPPPPVPDAAEDAAAAADMAPRTTPGPAASADDDDQQAAEEERVLWLPYSEVGRVWTDDTLSDGVKMQLGTFYQTLDAAGPLEDADRQYAELISDDDRPHRRRLPVWDLLHFALGVALLNMRLLLGAYGLLLCGLVFRLALPRVEGAIFDAFNALEMGTLRSNLMVAVGLVAADVVFSFSGRIVLELFARQTMSRLFADFFEHILAQEITFFARLPAGELMARTSGDSLTLRSMVTATAYQLTEGSALVFGSAGCLLLTLGPLWWRAPSLLVALLVGLALSGLEGFGLGLVARTLNLRVRQSLGRMFGFSLDVFRNMDAVGALGLEGRLIADYRCFARDYFSNTFKLNSLLVFHKAFTFGLAAAVRGAMLWLGGVALFADLTTVGSLFMMLRYVTWMQRGIKQASDAYARVAASIGSLERVVELHNRGVFRDAAHTLGREKVPVPVDDDEEEDGEDHDVGAHNSEDGDRHGGLLTRPLLQQLDAHVPSRWRFWRATKPRKVRVVELPPEARPDFGAMLGGVRLEGVHLTLRSKTDKLVLADASLELLAGQAAIITGAPGSSKSSLLQLVMLRHMPFKGYIAFQLPDSAVTAAAAEGQAPGSAGHAGSSGGAASGQQPPAAAAVAAAAAAAGAEGAYDGTRGPGASLSYGTAPGGPGWVWCQFSFLKDDQKAARRAMAMVSVSSAVLFRTSIEDNVACAAAHPVTGAAVRAACAAVGAHDAIMSLPEGYRSLVGDGSGTSLSWPLLLQLALARALVRRPRLLLLDDADQFAAALGTQRLRGILSQLQHRDGVTLIVAAARPEVLLAGGGLDACVYCLRDGLLSRCSPS